MKNGVKNPRGQKHVAAVVDYVRHCGGDDAARRGRQAVRRRYRELGVEVRA